MSAARRPSRLVAALGLLLAAPLASQAAAPAAPSVGASATYRWTSAVRQPVLVLVREPQAGGQATWSAVQESAAPPPVFVTYSIVRGDRATYTLQIVTHDEAEGAPLSVTQVTVNRASGKALRSVTRGPKGVVPTPESGLRPFREAGMRDGRREEVEVPAGRFPAASGTSAGARVWVSDRVPALGLVKAEWPAGTLELVRSAPAGATDLLKPATR